MFEREGERRDQEEGQRKRRNGARAGLEEGVGEGDTGRREEGGGRKEQSQWKGKGSYCFFTLCIESLSSCAVPMI